MNSEELSTLPPEIAQLSGARIKGFLPLAHLRFFHGNISIHFHITNCHAFSETQIILKI